MDLIEAKNALQRRTAKLRGYCTVHEALPKLTPQAPTFAEGTEEYDDQLRQSNIRLKSLLDAMRDEWKASGALASVIQEEINARLDFLTKHRASELLDYVQALETLVKVRAEVGNLLSKYIRKGPYPYETEFAGTLRRYMADPVRFHADPDYSSGALERGEHPSRAFELHKARLASVP